MTASGIPSPSPTLRDVVSLEADTGTVGLVNELVEDDACVSCVVERAGVVDVVEEDVVEDPLGVDAAREVPVPTGV